MADETLDETLATLVGQAKDKCQITWEDEATDRRFEDEIVPTALVILSFKIGIPGDADFSFASPGLEHDLFLNYCYYAWHNATDDFEQNYANSLAQARRIWEVKGAQEEEATA